MGLESSGKRLQPSSRAKDTPQNTKDLESSVDQASTNAAETKSSRMGGSGILGQAFPNHPVLPTRLERRLYHFLRVSRPLRRRRNTSSIFYSSSIPPGPPKINDAEIGGNFPSLSNGPGIERRVFIDPSCEPHLGQPARRPSHQRSVSVDRS